MELLDIVDENAVPTGEVCEREEVHEKGLLHRTAHVWLFRKKEGEVELLLQKRSVKKESYPECYDISSAGHIPAGVDFIPSAIRELQEELGITVDGSELIFCGLNRVSAKNEFYGKDFLDEEINAVYLLPFDGEDCFTLQEEEVESVRWMPLKRILSGVKKNGFPHCIHLPELALLQKTLREFCFTY